MTRYEQIVDIAWADAELFAESVPHLLHQDLAYLWILERDARQRPNGWRPRIEGWKYIVQLFFSGELAPELVSFPEQPLINLTKPYGIDTVTFLKIPAGSGASPRGRLPETVGVLSSTVLVRPLPDFNVDWLQDLRAVVEQKVRPEDVSHFVHLAIQQLSSSGTSEYGQRLAAILRREFTPAEAPQPATGIRMAVPILRKVEWAQRGSLAADDSLKVVQSTTVLVRGQEAATRTFVPRCQACNSLLTRKETDLPIDILADTVDVPCLEGNCGATNTFPLSRFLVWNRDSNRVLVWERDAEFVSFEMELPPARPRVQGITIKWEWNEAFTGGDKLRRFLIFQFPGKIINTARPSDVFYKKLLVPGDLATFSGFPVRPGWTDAVDVKGATIRTAREPLLVDIENITLHGWPVPVARRPRRFSIMHEPTLGVGIFPSPELVGPQWQLYRSFLDGPPAPKSTKPVLDSYRLVVPRNEAFLRNVATSTDGVPTAISVTTVEDDALGVTYFPNTAPITGEQGSHAHISVDFGTTNSVVYFKGPTHDPTEDPSPGENAISPRQIARSIHWFADHGRWSEQAIIAGFLPGPQYRVNAGDRYLFPSAVWLLASDRLSFRWTSEAPQPAANAAVVPRPLARFKWDPQDSGRGYQAERTTYLTELLLLTLPAMFASTERFGTATLGVAFPLAFNYSERDRFATTLADVQRRVLGLTGVNIGDIYSISESSACVQAFGRFNRGDTFLVADMGGGTLDVVLFTFGARGAVESHQIGSIRYAGESFVSAVAQRQAADNDAAAAAAWQIRDAIGEGTSHRVFANQQSTEEILDRFTTYAFEYLRTMIAAFRIDQEGAQVPIKLVLVGNGWNLAAAFSRRRAQDGDERVVEETYNQLVALLGEANLTIYRAQIYDRGEHILNTKYSKHMVAIGALKNTRGPQKQELQGVPEYSRMPAGRRMKIAGKKIDWSDLVGAGAPFDGVDLQTVRTDNIEFSLVTMAPLRNRAWRQRLLSNLGADDETNIPYPDHAQLSEQTRLSIAGIPPKLERGPLQLILENYWSRRLARGRQ